VKGSTHRGMRRANALGLARLRREQSAVLRRARRVGHARKGQVEITTWHQWGAGSLGKAGPGLVLLHAGSPSMYPCALTGTRSPRRRTDPQLIALSGPLAPSAVTKNRADASSPIANGHPSKPPLSKGTSSPAQAHPYWRRRPTCQRRRAIRTPTCLCSLAPECGRGAADDVTARGPRSHNSTEDTGARISAPARRPRRPGLRCRSCCRAIP
jgi:hypothetical protein